MPLNRFLKSRHKSMFWTKLSLVAAWFALLSPSVIGQEVGFERVQLSNQFYSEGGTFADYDGDGQGDVAIGPWIYWGGDFENASRFYEGDAIDPVGYSKNFLMYSGDANDDGQPDIYVLGFPGDESWWYENPGPQKASEGLWQRHTMLDVTDNESPMMKDIDGDGLDDLVCSSKGHYGYATRAGQDPKLPWRFVQISPNNGYQRFTHGIGVGDVDNDGNQDLLEKDGWWKNPGKVAAFKDTEGQFWTFHKFEFSGGGSQMHAVDFDGDGKNEVLTGLAAHGYGLVYYKALNAEATQFERVDIMTADPATSPVGIAVSQLHAVEVADMNSDGIPDIVTGKRWWAHANGDPGSAEPATLVWFETQRSGGRVSFVPHIVDNSSGVGTQVSVGDVNGDGLLDIVSGIKRGAYLFLQRPSNLQPTARLISGLAEKDPFAQLPAESMVKIEGDDASFLPALGERVLNFSFDSPELMDWEIRGPMASKAIRDGVVDTGSDAPGAIGELISRPFRLLQDTISFEVAGSGSADARVEVVAEESGKPIASSNGSGEQALSRQTFDVSNWNGQLVRIRVVDHAKDGFVRFDNFKMHARQ